MNMKVFNLVMLSYALAFLGTLLLCEIGSYFGIYGIFIIIIPAIFLGAKSRSIVEKLVGYSLKEAIEEDLKK